MNCRKTVLTAATMAMTGMMVFSLNTTKAYAKEGNSLPSAGISFDLSDTAVSIKEIKDNVKQVTTNVVNNLKDSLKDKDKSNKYEPDGSEEEEQAKESSSPSSTSSTDTIELPVVEEIPEEEKVVEETKVAATDKTVEEQERAIAAKKEEESFKNLVIAKCNDWVNVRKEPNTDSEIVGFLYDKSAGEFLEEENGWYKISSGSCTGYVSAEYCVTGEDAVELAKKVGTRVATVDTTTLYVRAEATTDSACLGMVPLGEVLTVSEELDGWAKVNIEEGDGYVSLDYVKLSTEFVRAESMEAYNARKAKEEAARQAAIEAATKASAKNKKSSSKKQTYYATGPGSELGKEVANYALQFVGNPYVYGGVSLTNGADCSGFVLSVYKHFGVSLPHSANADRNMGYAVDGVENAWPGDLICYSGHVGIYIGNGKIVHASTSKTGIIVSNVSYRSVLAVRRIF